jgi:SAM-dependent methyltransferase
MRDLQYWEDQADTYEEARHAVLSEGDWEAETTRHLDQIGRLLVPWQLPDGPIAEIGCGVGRLTWQAGLDWERGDIVGLDISPKMLAHARGRFPADADWLPLPRFEQMTDRSLVELQPAGIFTMLTLQHLDSFEVRQILDQAHRGLRPGGRIVFQFVEGADHSAHSHDYGIAEMVTILELAGFDHSVSWRHDEVFPQWVWMVGEKR